MATDSPEPRWHSLPPEEVIRRLATDLRTGLSEQDAQGRLRRWGPNTLPEPAGRSPLRIFLDQFQSVLVLVLVVAVVLSALLGELLEAAAVAAILVLNALLGTSQEYRAERAMEALRRLLVPQARVRREGRIQQIPSARLVPGDVVVLEAGDRVPADVRLVEAAGLRTDESTLTGESEPVDKDAAAQLDPRAPLVERCTMAYAGTTVTAGRGVGVVVATGLQTEVGRVASLVAAVRSEPTPLQRRLEGLARLLGVVALGIVAVVTVLGFLRGEGVGRVLLVGVSLAVAAVPEGLPAVLTIALSLGAQRMLRRRALIRKLGAVETLGSITVVCTDKTGTLTQGRLSVARWWIPGDTSGVPPAFLVAALCNDAQGDADHRAVGDPVDVALMEAIQAEGGDAPGWRQGLPRTREWPFDARRKRMVTVHRVENPQAVPWLEGAPYAVLVKGAPEVVVPACTRWWTASGAERLGDEERASVNARVEAMAREGIRVLALAFRPAAAPPDGEEAAAEGLVLAGLVGLVDPLRPEVPQAVATCHRAGIRVVMVTGDHPVTAQAIARAAGIVEDPRAPVVTGPELEDLPREVLERRVREVSVYARVVPEQKLRLVEILQRQGEVVAVTGDGVNDGPALRRADVGVAMGSGTEVAKEASEMVLLDDHFATLVAAVEEGRVVFDNVRKFVRYLFTTNAAELVTMLTAGIAGLPFPLYPLQILWINLITDGLPALALALEPPEEDVMDRPPRRRGEPVLDRASGWAVAWVGILMGLMTLGIGAGYLRAGDPRWQTVVFAGLAFAQFGSVYALRTRGPAWRIALRNRALTGAVALGIVLQLGVVYLPPLQRVFRTLPLDPYTLGATLLPGIVALAAMELEKAARRAWRVIAS
ncbi:MAG: cation-translocating P-type ATPase [Armatimonadota bacterium]|nr:cation-translocating P-type ATPase [Armatimonadota bacterium]